MSDYVKSVDIQDAPGVQSAKAAVMGNEANHDALAAHYNNHKNTHDHETTGDSPPIPEIVAARGAAASLSARLSAAINPDGTLKVAAGDAVGVWTGEPDAVTHVSGTVFSVPGDKRAVYAPGRAVKADVTGATVFSMVKAVTYTGSATEVTLTDSVLNAGLSGVDAGIQPEAAPPELYNRLADLEDNLMIETFYRLVGDEKTGPEPFTDGWADTLQDETGIDAAESTGYAYNAAGDYVQVEREDFGDDPAAPSNFAVSASEESEKHACCILTENGDDYVLTAWCIRDASTGPNRHGKVRAGLINADGTVTFSGNEVTVHYAETYFTDLCKIGENKALLLWSAGGPGTLKMAVVTLSGGNPNVGDAVSVLPSDEASGFGRVCRVEDDKALVFAKRNTGNMAGDCVVVTVSGTTPTANTPVRVTVDSSISGSGIDITPAFNGLFLAFYGAGGSPNTGRAVVVSVSGTTPAIAATEVEFTTNDIGGVRACGIADDCAVAIFQDASVSSRAHLATFEYSGGSLTFKDKESLEGTYAASYYGVEVVPGLSDYEGVAIHGYLNSTTGYMKLVEFTADPTSKAVTLGTQKTLASSNGSPGNDQYTYLAALRHDTMIFLAYCLYQTTPNTKLNRFMTTIRDVKDLVLVFEAYEVNEEPGRARAVIVWEDVTGDTALNTDLVVYSSNDDGVTWEALPLSDQGAFDASARVASGGAYLTLTGETDTRLLITAGNDKEIRIHHAAHLLGA